MPSYSGSENALATKLVTLYPGNVARGFPAHNGVVINFDPENGIPNAVSIFLHGDSTKFLFAETFFLLGGTGLSRLRLVNCPLIKLPTEKLDIPPKKI